MKPNDDKKTTSDKPVTPVKEKKVMIKGKGALDPEFLY